MGYSAGNQQTGEAAGATVSGPVVLAFLALAYVGGPLVFLQAIGPAYTPEALSAVSVTILCACASYLFISVTHRPFLVLGLPMSAGWLVARWSPEDPALAAILAGLTLVAGALAGSGIALAERVQRRWVLAAVTLVATELVSSALRLGVPSVPETAIAPDPAFLLTCLAGGAVAMVATARLAHAPIAAGLYLARDRRRAAELGYELDRALLIVGGLGGAMAAAAGLALAVIATAPAGAVLTLVFAAAAWLGRGLLLPTLAAAGGLWLIPELAGRAVALGGLQILVTAAVVGITLLTDTWLRRRKAHA